MPPGDGLCLTGSYPWLAKRKPILTSFSFVFNSCQFACPVYLLPVHWGGQNLPSSNNSVDNLLKAISDLLDIKPLFSILSAILCHPLPQFLILP